VGPGRSGSGGANLLPGTGSSAAPMNGKRSSSTLAETA
jgi:hypothetical protein